MTKPIHRLRTGASASSGSTLSMTRCWRGVGRPRTAARSGASGSPASTSRPAVPDQPAAMPIADRDVRPRSHTHPAGPPAGPACGTGRAPTPANGVIDSGPNAVVTCTTSNMINYRRIEDISRLRFHATCPVFVNLGAQRCYETRIADDTVVAACNCPTDGTTREPR